MRLAAGPKAAVIVHFLQAMADKCVLHDYFSGVDNVLEIPIVIADGNHIIANADLF